MEETKCKNPVCGKIVNALHMDDEGYCDECHDKILDGLLIQESEETRFLSDQSLQIICEQPTRLRAPIGKRHNMRI